eukprot:CAMPEP_0170456856 /NCGR_PEP_ID=MMETSP0123-20130129/4346_1 /TAXON_ID=182087 /ORGANISM="Favella ehrenbergii, Strain Fehren 1" /LENGTH=89 /DNA_ID=CAMNT_0010720463 /DNA_START=2247 /DNA_END=2516 /DNA_ORIENTATION=+
MIEHSDKLLLLMQKAYILFYEKKWIFEDQPVAPLRKSSRLSGVIVDERTLPKEPKSQQVSVPSRAGKAQAMAAMDTTSPVRKQIKIKVG